MLVMSRKMETAPRNVSPSHRGMTRREMRFLIDSTTCCSLVRGTRSLTARLRRDAGSTS